jgi:colanic acid/amylovoran biosynthesis protein
MRILVDSCSYNCSNNGDLAMLTVAVSRLRELWPSASIKIITNAPGRIARHCGDVGTVPVRGRRLLLEDRLLGRLGSWLPAAIAEPWARYEKQLVLQRPELFRTSLELKSAVQGRDVSDAAAFLDAVNEADLVVVNGAGIMTDAFLENALGILTTLDFAIRKNVPTALLGQGLGPITDPELRRRAAEVLPFVTLIGVRESETSVRLLSALGVNPRNVVVTGDDAIELAFAAVGRRRAAADDRRLIGVNVRVASYAGVESGMLAELREAFAAAAKALQARMVPIPIAHHGGGMDVDSLKALISGIGDDTDGGAALDSPELVIDRVGECRLVVTGSYHGAVFALAQGIPAVALVQSEYYVNKMVGLQRQFTVGCEVLRLDEPRLPERLSVAIARAWTDAEDVRLPLLSAATDQINRGRAAYARLRDVVESLQDDKPTRENVSAPA